jgi:uncharacterized membrane protein YesL
MGLFKPYNYKPSKGIDKDAPVKHGFFIFWEIFFRKFWRFVTINLIYFVVTLPMLLVAYLMAVGYLSEYLPTIGDILTGAGILANIIPYIPSVLYKPLVLISVILYGPATMGMTYILRNFARQEHAWMSDFFSRAWSNFRQGLFFGILDVIVVSLLSYSIFIGYGDGLGTWLPYIIKGFAIFALIVYLFMRHYFYMLAVTVNLRVRDILKNSWLFVVLGFKRNIWAGLVNILTWFVTLVVTPIIPALSVAVLMFLTYSFSGFATVFICYPVVKKYVVVPAMEREQAEIPPADALPSDKEEPEFNWEPENENQ